MNEIMGPGKLLKAVLNSFASDQGVQFGAPEWQVLRGRGEGGRIVRATKEQLLNLCGGVRLAAEQGQTAAELKQSAGVDRAFDAIVPN